MRLTRFFLVLVLSLGLVLPLHSESPTYLPFVTNGTTPSASPSIDLDHLQTCNYSELAKLDATSEPDYTSTKGCLSKSVIMGFPDHAQADDVNSASTNDALVPSQSALHLLNCTACTSANGVIQMQANISSQKIIIPSLLWHTYFLGNNFGVRDTRSTITCQNGLVTYPSMRVGIGLGRATGDMAIVNNRRLYWEVHINGSCLAYTDPNNPSFAISGNASPKFEIYRSGISGTSTYWTARVWLGTWVILFANLLMPINGSANGAFAGQIVSATDSCFSCVIELSNFVHKIELASADLGAYRSWHSNSAPLQLTNVTTYAPSVFNVMDIIGGDWTSFSSNINQ